MPNKSVPSGLLRRSEMTQMEIINSESAFFQVLYKGKFQIQTDLELDEPGFRVSDGLDFL